MRPYPLLLEPILKERVWGGRRLAQLGRDLPPGSLIGESWEVADLPEDVSVIRNGGLAGRTLREAIAAHRDLITGSAALVDGRFPLLIKYLDAENDLSVQVHPSETYGRRHPGAHVKHEAWVVLWARPGAQVYLGVRPGISRAQFDRDARSGRIVADLRALPVRAGDCIRITSGIVHALGGGTVVAEVQTPSDTTFRLYDWGRTGRELHVEQALEALLWDPDPGEVRPSRRPIQTLEVGALRTTPLLDEEFFRVDRVEVVGDRHDLEVVTDDVPVVWMVTAGGGTFTGGTDIGLGAGTTVLMPAALRGAVATLEPGSSVLEVRPAHPTRKMIAHE